MILCHVRFCDNTKSNEWPLFSDVLEGIQKNQSKLNRINFFTFLSRLPLFIYVVIQLDVFTIFQKYIENNIYFYFWGKRR